jgi:tetratricopeptide (TPR) repeat protein
LRNGDFEKAAEAGIQNIDENNPEQVAARGEYRWLSYFKQSRVANTPIKVDDDPVKQALEDFGKVASNAAATPETKADVLLWTGHIHEMAGDTVKAGTTYQTAAAQFAAEPALKRRFDVALIRLGLQTAGKPAGIGRLPADEQERLLLVALLLPMLQEPVPPTTKPESQEAGYDFWEAVALARDRKFADALKKLDSARNLHDKRRFAQLRKSQNPMSDPNEDIFIRACDELRGYWQLQERLRAGGYLQAADEPGKAVETLISYVKGFRDLGDKLVKEKVVGDAKDLEKGIDQLLADRKNVEAEKAKVAKLADALVKAKVIAKPEDLEQGLTKLLTDRAAAEKQVADLNTAVKEAQAEAKKEKDLVTAAEAKVKTADELKKTLKQELVSAKYIDANADDQKIIQGLKDAIKVATTDSSKEAMRKLQVELTQARDQMAAHGDVLKALALRNEHKYAEAKTALEKAKSSLAKEDKPFQDAADAALKEVSNLGALYLARADALQNQGKYEDAVGALTRAVEISPQDKGALLAKRSLVELAAAKDKATGKLIGNEPMVTAAKKDAEEASTAGAAMGHYAAGRVAEELGDYNAAVQSYRQAVAAQPDPAGDGSLFRIALARVLLMSRPEKPAVPKDEPKLGLLDRTDKRPTPEAVMLLFAFTLQPPLGQQPANVEEANKLADEILKLDKSKVPYEVRAQALAIKNLWTEALRNYAEGLKANLDRQHADELMYLLDNHPKLKGPDSERIANPLMAEAHYGAGIRHYFNKRYSDAEKEFALAIKNESQDARYHYFLGLSRLAQDKNEAYEDFAEGALLEARGRPSRAAVSVALERVQGPVRTLINAARDKVR